MGFGVSAEARGPEGLAEQGCQGMCPGVEAGMSARGDNCQGLGSLQELVPSLCSVSSEETEKGVRDLHTGVCDWESWFLKGS